MLSLVFWTLTLVTSIKYVLVAMSIDNDGEGGILALMSLLGVKRVRRPAIVAFGLLGAALIYGDGAITPAISVLSALEGLNIAAPSFQPYVVPAAVAIMALLFVVQPFGTARIGAAFGPIMARSGLFRSPRSDCGASRRNLKFSMRSIPITACVCSRAAACAAFSFLAASFSASPAPRRSMPT